MNDIDVIIPVRDRARYIGACLDSVRAQTFAAARVIVADDGSTDETPDILAAYAQSWPQLEVLRTPPRGVSHARNRALARCRSPLVAFLDSDDLWRPRKLELQAALFDAPAAPGFVHCGCFEIDETGDRLAGSADIVPRKHGDIFAEMACELYHVTGSASAVVARRDLVMEAGGFDETLRFAEDQDLWLALASRASLNYVPEVLVGLRRHRENTYYDALAKNVMPVLIDKLAVWNKWLDRVGTDSAALDRLRRWVIQTARLRPSGVRRAFRIYRQLRQVDLPIVTLLFPHYGVFLKSLYANRR